jgi:hypothetical protein
VTFSSSNKTLALHSGAEDRASVLLQLAALGKADPGWFQAGRRFRIQAGGRPRCNGFVFEVVEETTLKTTSAHLPLLHLRRPPLAGKYNSALDIWLAPIRTAAGANPQYRESNGAVTTNPAQYGMEFTLMKKILIRSLLSLMLLGSAAANRRNGRIFTGTVCRIALHD